MDDSTDDMWGVVDDAPPSPNAKTEQQPPTYTTTESEDDGNSMWGMDPEEDSSNTDEAGGVNVTGWGAPEPSPELAPEDTVGEETTQATALEDDMWGEVSSSDQNVEEAPEKEETTQEITETTVDEEKQSQENAATKIQARTRGRKERKELKEQREGAEKIQARFRGNYGRKKVKIQKEENIAASKIQARARGRNQRKQLEEQKEQELAATKIQARIRGKNQRSSKDKEEQNAAAAKIQARARGRKLRAEKAREQAAIAKIQAMERGRQTRKNMPTLSNSDQKGEFARTVGGAKGIDTTIIADQKVGIFQNSKGPREYIFPSNNILVADTGMQTQLLPPDAPPRTPTVIITLNDVLETYLKGITSLFKAYTSKNGMNRTGHKATFEDIRKKEQVIDRAGFNQICAHFKLVANVRQKKRLNAQGKRILPNAEGWYKLWSLLPSNINDPGYAIASDIRSVNIQEIARAATGEPAKRRGKSFRSIPKSERATPYEASIRFGQTVETSGIVASIDVLPDDINTPPTISDHGEIPMTANTILQIFNHSSGSDNNFLGLDVNGLGKAIATIAYDGVRRLIPAEHLIQAEMKKNTARLAFFRQVLPTMAKLKWKPQFRHYNDFPELRVFYEKVLRRQRREARTHVTRSHHIFAKVTRSWTPDVPTQRVAMTAFKRFYKGGSREDGSPARLFQQGGMEINKNDIVHIICRRTTKEHEEHIDNLKYLELDPRYGLAGPGRFLEKDPKNEKESIKRRPGDWWLGIMVSYKGELIEEGIMSGWFPASNVAVVNIEDDMDMHEEEAAEMMQASLRGHLVRKNNVVKWDACQQIQKIARGMIQRRRFERAKYVLRGVAEAIISKRLMSLTKAQCCAALLNRMRMGQLTQLRRRIMKNNNGFAFGESNNSSVKWSVRELEQDVIRDTMILSNATSKALYYPKKSLTLEEERDFQRNKLLFTKTKDDLVNELRMEEDVYALNSSTVMNDAAMDAYGVTGTNDEDTLGEEMNNGLDEDETNWLDNIGLKNDNETNDGYVQRMQEESTSNQYDGMASGEKLMPPLTWDQLEHDANSATAGGRKGRRRGNGTKSTFSTKGEFDGSANQSSSAINTSNIVDNSGSINPNRAKPRALFVSKDGSPVLTWNEIEKINMNDLNNAVGTLGNPGQRLKKRNKPVYSRTSKYSQSYKSNTNLDTNGKYGRAAGAGREYGRSRNMNGSKLKVMSYNDEGKIKKQSPLQAKRNLKKSQGRPARGSGKAKLTKQPQAPPKGSGRRVKFAKN